MGQPRKERKKFYLVSIFITGLFLLMGYKSFELQVLQRDSLSLRAKKQHATTRKIPPIRGIIYDRNEKPLATTVPATSIYLRPGEIKDSRKLAAISKPLGISRKKLLGLASSKKPVVWVKRWEDPETARKIREMRLPGVGFVEGSKRIYPNGSLLGQVIGFTDTDLKGIEGIEYSFEETLAGEAITVKIRTDAKGRNLSGIQDSSPREPKKGNNLVLTVDSRIQHIVESELERGVKEMKADRGSAVLMNPQTGEILAMASYPFFNPNNFSMFPGTIRRNLPVWFSFEPGSTLKVFLAATLLEEKMGNENTRYDCNNGIQKIGSNTIKDTHGHGILTVSETIAYSSNICAWKIGETLGTKKLHESLVKFGFGRKNGVDLPGEASGKIQNIKNWGDIELATISFGQGISVTPIQLASALSSIANGGYLIKPRIVRKIVSPEGRVLTEKKPEILKKVTSYDTTLRVTGILEEVVKYGTGANAAIPGYRIAGKTGTAQVPNPKTGTYHKDKYISSFIGFAPADEPSLTLVVIVENPRQHIHGGDVAAPIFRSITEKVLAYKGIPPNKKMLKEVIMPDMVNKSARAVMKWAEREEVSVRFIGSGYVVSQHPPSGEKIKRGTDCTFTLKQDI
ncbi:MAG: penicillin-binding protein [Candidatus Dadabacteria bacterium]|nr:penicillin-binding protein [Candidatus Dadabacteria bacterium]